MNINILEIAVAAVILLFAAAGYRKGFVKKLAAMVSLLVSVVLVSALLPWITAFLKENTPVYTMVEEQCRTVMEKQIGEAMFSGAEKSTGESSQADIYRNMGREEIKALMEANGYDGSLLDALSDEQLEQYKEQYIQQYFSSDTTNSGESDNSGAVLLGNLTRIEQTELIENLPLLEFLRFCSTLCLLCMKLYQHRRFPHIIRSALGNAACIVHRLARPVCNFGFGCILVHSQRILTALFVHVEQ